MTDKQSQAALSRFKSLTPARVAVGRSGSRPTTKALLSFLGDHAEARDAVKSNLSNTYVEQFCRSYGAITTQSKAENRDDFILFPPRGKRLNDESLAALSSALQKFHSTSIDVCIVISDGLSALAVEENVSDLYPMLIDGFDSLNLRTGPPVIVRFGRVAVADQIGQLFRAKVVINLIGERPGLSCARGLSAYITYNPHIEKTISSDRTVVSNIHTGGTPPVEAGAFIVKIVERILEKGVSGVRLQALG